MLAEPRFSLVLWVALALGTTACDGAPKESGAGAEGGTKAAVESSAQPIESPIGDFVVEIPAGFGTPLWKAKGPKDVNVAASAGKRTVEVRSSPNIAEDNSLLTTEGLFKLACNAVEGSKDNIVDFSDDIEVDGHMARIYRTHPADPNKTGAVKMMFVASDERFYAVSMAAPTAAELDAPAAKDFFESFHVKSPKVAANHAETTGHEPAKSGTDAAKP